MEMPFASVEVFCSYAEQDAFFLKQLEKHLSVLRRSGTIMTWHRRKIIAGSDWEHELDHHLNTASLILLFISSDFLASDYQYGVEMQRAMQRHNANEARVIPIVVRPCDWKGASFEQLQIVPRNGNPVILWRNRDAGFSEVAKEIRAALETMHPLTLSAPSVALPKIWQIPYPRNPVFTGRDDLLQMLTEILQTDHAAALSQPEAISGLGGIGKTQLAVEYAYRTASKYQAVFWVTAETQETLVSGYAGLAMALNLQEKDEPDQSQMLQAVQRWLRTHTNWLLILDNAEDLRLAQSFVPPVFGGRVLLTTRVHATGRFAHHIDLDTLTNDDGTLLLLRRAGVLSAQGVLEQAKEDEIALAHQISDLLGQLPLALDQAGAYMEETGCGLAGYHRLYEMRQSELLGSRGGLIDDHPEPVATTWSLSFVQVEQRNPAAADLLRLCAFLAPDAIPEELLMEGAKALGEVLAPVAADAYLLDQAIATLRAYSLLTRDPQTRTFSIHRLVQAVVRDSLPTEVQQQWMQHAVHAVAAASGLEFANWPVYKLLLPHVLLCATWIERLSLAPLKTSLLLNQAGYYLNNRGHYEKAEPLYVRAFAIREQELGTQHPDTVASLNNLAALYQSQRKYAQAEPLYMRAFAIREQELGTQHPDTVASLNNLAALYQSQGKYAQAEQLYQRILAIREQTLGPEHLDTASSLNDLSSLYYQQGTYEQALPLLTRELAIREQRLGLLHPETAQCLNDLAATYLTLGKYEQAEPFYEQAFTIREQLLGPLDIDTMFTLGDLEDVYQKLGKYAQAEALGHHVVTIHEQQFGPTDPNTASSLNNLANVYKNQGKYAQAEPLYQRAFVICEEQLGLMHPNTASTLSGLASCAQSKGEYGEAEQLYQRALHIREQTLGPKHPYVILSLNDLADLYACQGKYEEAEQFYERALAIREQQLGAQHSDTAISLNNLAQLYKSQGKYALAEPLYVRALAIFENILGPDHPTTQAVRANCTSLLQVMEHKKKRGGCMRVLHPFSHK